MIRWRFRTFVSHTGRNDVQDTINAYDPYSRQAFSRAVAHLSTKPKAEWDEPQAKKLKGQDPLYEIRYTANKRSERPLGYFQPDGVTFAIVLICFHKGRVYEPPEAFDSAKKRINKIQSREASTVPLQVSGKPFPADEE